MHYGRRGSARTREAGARWGFSFHSEPQTYSLSKVGVSKPTLGEKNMRFRRSLMGIAGVLGVVATASAAPPPWSNARHYRGPSHEEYEYARVVDVDPIVRQVRVETPRRECWDETRYVDSQPHISDAQVGGRTLLGAAIGGVIGHQFGSGRGQDAATVAGALIGAGVGYDSAAKRYPQGGHEQVVQRCDVRYEHEVEERIEGYRVTYEYNGRHYNTQLPYDPGDRIRVRVAVAPAE